MKKKHDPRGAQLKAFDKAKSRFLSTSAEFDSGFTEGWVCGVRWAKTHLANVERRSTPSKKNQRKSLLS